MMVDIKAAMEKQQDDELHLALAARKMIDAIHYLNSIHNKELVDGLSNEVALLQNKVVDAYEKIARRKVK
jgi:hypothetical protein